MFSTVIQSVRFMAQLGVSLTVAIGILLNTFSFSSAKTSAAPMSCCDAAGHCNSALMARQTAAEPMCGQTASNDLDAITVYAEPDQTSDTSESVSVTSPCAPDCSSLHWAASVSSKRGFAALIQRRPVERRLKQVLKSAFEFRNVFVSTPSRRSVPRGPPMV